MTWKLDAAIALLASPGAGILEALGRKRGGLILLAAVAVIAFGAGGAAVAWGTDALTFGPRLTQIEGRFEAHLEETSDPAIARLDRLEDEWRSAWAQDGDMRIMQQMVYEMYCDRFPSRCQAQPSR